MKKRIWFPTATLSIVLVLGITLPVTLYAATDPGIGAASTFSIVSQTAITGTGTISGDVGLNSTGAGITALTDPMVTGTIYSTDGVSPSVGILNAAVQANLSSANGDISSQSSTASIGPVLDGEIRSTGVYDIGAGRLNGGILTLDGPGIYIFRASSDFVSSGSINLINGARACDVYWQVNTLASINGSSFVGTIIAGTGVHFGTDVSLNGRALALGGDVTLLNTTISGPTCAALPPAPQLIVNKIVINDNNGVKVISSFPLFVDGVSVTSGVATTTSAGVHTVSETSDTGYNAVISGDCSSSGTVTLALGDVKTCTITNDDVHISGGGYVAIPPVISVVKVPSPLALPDGPGIVKYTYTLRNIGIVPVTSVTMVGDTCSPIVLMSGDTNADTKLDVNESWVYTCSTTLTKTHTNIVTATGWANGISATDIASATVVVGVPLVPPLIHVTKVPNPIALSSAGGLVTYTNKVTNPGVVPLSNIRLSDDKCLPVKYVSGDTNSDSKLDTSETWTYTCSANLKVTTVNTISASGEANGFTAKDFAIVTVVVNANVPKLPNTGFPSEGRDQWIAIVAAGVIAMLALFYFVQKRKIA